jgi:hypothetical protein
MRLARKRRNDLWRAWLGVAGMKDRADIVVEAADIGAAG